MATAMGAKFSFRGGGRWNWILSELESLPETGSTLHGQALDATGAARVHFDQRLPAVPMQSSLRGKLVTWKADKAYGFIRPDEGGKDVFVHLRDFGRIGREPRVGDVCTFQKMADGTGRVRAADVSIPGVARMSRPVRQSAEMKARPVHLAIALAWFAAMAGLVTFHGLPLVAAVASGIASVVAFAGYALDKNAAMNRRWRTAESTLLLAGLLGGWPGALVAQGMFRHKSSKASFQSAFWFTVIVNCGAAAWWYFSRNG